MNQRALSILRLLNDGQFQSGVSLARKLSCKRADISNALKNIDLYGIEIVKIRGQGYCWINPIVYLNKDSILRNSSIYPRKLDIALFDTLDSTNTLLLNNLEREVADNNCVPVVATEYQTKGRGRAGRAWHSGFGDSLTFSFGWWFDQGVSALSGLSLLIGIAVIRVLRSLSINCVRLKWPNDILFENKKLAGILIELRGENLGPSHAVIGIGINFKLSEVIKSSINKEIIDLSSISDVLFDRNQILSALLTEFLNILPIFRDYGFAYFKNEWISYHAFEGQVVSLILPNGSVVVGTVDGVIEDGSICLLTSSGRNSYKVGDISICLNNL
ncbi:MAG: biotin--[acetyl-CoA-carboxylase] ligase [Nitrosomonas sp.]|uniref:biotin--[acetyl-CoA-carboxylase] ligase n=1 Tax=Nitrosomonas sp. TaxID=42353 RepID=UPI0027359B9E|nr:biotin--[acetyl-CoA-carboxylase] ligase [Nitrosomonas sp.]MDP3662606.1 biotin--[acetyl-CoA-carboxylase] ligase [Nitrosomonas sp.]MDZ4104591.1 biotin--[acetyl-CoA-carboxylase] ligase [Nitrosomonas sp.]